MNEAEHKGGRERIVDWASIPKRAFSLIGIWKFTRDKVPPISVIWVGIGVLLKISLFVNLFNWFGRHFSSSLFSMQRVGASEAVDITPFFLIATSAIVCITIFTILLGFFIKICFLFGKGRPVKLEDAVARFARKISDQASDCLVHASAATIVLLVEGNPERYGERVVYWCWFMAAFMYFMAAMGYRED